MKTLIKSKFSKPIHYLESPSSLFDWMVDERLFNEPTDNFIDSGDVYELELLVPGLSKKDVSVYVRDNRLFIEGFKSISKDKEGGYISNQLSISKSYKLPGNIRENKITAKCKHGLLRISIPKLKSNKKAIPIKGISDQALDATVSSNRKTFFPKLRWKIPLKTSFFNGSKWKNIFSSFRRRKFGI